MAALISASSLSALGQVTPVQAWGHLKVTGPNLQTQDGKNVQLRGMSLGWSSFNGTSADYFNAGVVKSLAQNWKSTVVRAPLGLFPNDGYNKGYEQDANQAALVKKVIDAAIVEGIYVVVDFHSHSAENFVSAATTFFNDISKTYGSKANIIYEIYNEPIKQDWPTVIKPYAKTIIDVIRKNDPDNIIIVGTEFYSQMVDKVVADPIPAPTNFNVMYTLHYYTNNTWTDPASGVTKYPHRIGSDDVGAKAKAAVAGKIPLFVTEYGTMKADGTGPIDEAESNKWYAFLDANNISYIGWQVNHDTQNGQTASALVTKGAIDGATSPNGTFMKNMLKAKYPANLTALVTANENEENANYSLVSPNPSSSNFNVTQPGDFNYTVLDVLGKVVTSGKATDNVIIGNDLQVGSYFLTVECAQGKKVVKLMKN